MIFTFWDPLSHRLNKYFRETIQPKTFIDEFTEFDWNQSSIQEFALQSQMFAQQNWVRFWILYIIKWPPFCFWLFSYALISYYGLMLRKFCWWLYSYIIFSASGPDIYYLIHYGFQNHQKMLQTKLFSTKDRRKSHLCMLSSLYFIDGSTFYGPSFPLFPIII